MQRGCHCGLAFQSTKYIIHVIISLKTYHKLKASKTVKIKHLRTSFFILASNNPNTGLST